MNRTVFVAAMLLVGLGILLAAAGPMVQACAPGLAHIAYLTAPEDRGAGIPISAIVPDVSAYYALCWACIVAGAVVGAAVYRADRRIGGVTQSLTAASPAGGDSRLPQTA